MLNVVKEIRYLKSISLEKAAYAYLDGLYAALFRVEGKWKTTIRMPIIIRSVAIYFLPSLITCTLAIKKMNKSLQWAFRL